MTNKKLVSLHLSEYKNIINDLKQEIEQLKLRLNEKGSDGEIFTNNLSEVDLRRNNVQQGISKGSECTCGRGEEID
jgi:predicted ribosome quality control (RQC) complex YloA/Tae2 family protein